VVVYSKSSLRGAPRAGEGDRETEERSAERETRWICVSNDDDILGWCWWSAGTLVELQAAVVDVALEAKDAAGCEPIFSSRIFFTPRRRDAATK
jgi:hypothetical protein